MTRSCHGFFGDQEIVRVPEGKVPAAFTYPKAHVRNHSFRFLGAARRDPFAADDGIVQLVQPASHGPAGIDIAEDEARAWAGRMATYPKLGLRYAKETIRLYQNQNRLAEHGEAEMERIFEITRTPDCAEGVEAFLDPISPRRIHVD